MYRLLVVDDEDAIRKGLMKKIDWNRVGFETPNVASDGEEALRIISCEKPHVILTDIRMPNMDGLELLRRIKKDYPSIRTIILSNYNDFEYAREGMRYGASAYILKPTSNEEIYSTFNGIYHELAEKDKQLAELSTIKSKSNEYLDLLKYNLLGDITSGRKKDIDEIINDFRVLKIDLYTETVCSAIFLFHGEINTDAYSHISNFKLDCCPVQYGDNVKFEALWEEINKLHIILTCCGGTPIMMLQALINDLWVYLKINTGLPISCGIGKTYNQITNLHTSFKEANLALSLTFIDGMGYTYRSSDYNLEIPSRENDEKLNRLECDCLNKIKSGLNTSLSNSIMKYFSEMRMDRVDLETIHKRCVRLLAFAKSIVDGVNLKAADKPELDEVYNFDSFKNKTFERIRGIVEAFCLEAAGDVRLNVNEKSPIDKVKEYIRENYAERINLEDIASRVYMNQSYFSEYFKEKTGKNFIDYLTEVRIENAKKLLENTSYRIVEIAGQVGYADSAYFCNLFRKINGETPLEYRKKIALGITPFFRA